MQTANNYAVWCVMHKEQAANKPPKSFRQIFSYLRELAEKNSNRAGPGHSRSRLNTVGGRNLFTK